MKINCGPTREEKMAEKYNKREKKREAQKKWDTWFAWFPVRVGPRQCIWLETVFRRKKKETSYNEHHWNDHNMYYDVWENWEYLSKLSYYNLTGTD